MSVQQCILGTAGLGGVWGSVDPAESVRTLLFALENGIEAIDTAPAYGDAEKYVGEALRIWKDAIPQISTKAGRLKSFDASEGYYDYSNDGIWRSIEQSLNTLGVEYVDILFLHEPECVPRTEIDRVVQTLLKIKEKGYAKKIGVGGNPPDWLRYYLQPGMFDVVMGFNKLNLCNTNALAEVIPYCTAKEVQYLVASPLNMGLLGDRFASYLNEPPSWLSKDILEAAVLAKGIADEQQLSLRALAHRFLLSLQYPFKIVIGASNKQQLTDTLNDFYKGPLDAELVCKLLNATKRTTPDVYNRQ